MRRTLAAAVAAAATCLSLAPALPPAAADDRGLPAAPTAPTAGAGRAAADRPDLGLAMRDLFVALPHLDPAARASAQRRLARPTDGPNDRQGDGYAVESSMKCGPHVCVHWVSETDDAPDNTAWVKRTLSVMNATWNQVVGKMGYRPPPSDKGLGPKRNGGNGKLDVYLKDLGARGEDGYCTPESLRKNPRYKFQAISYCVLDEDFAASQYGRAPYQTLKVTAARQFFHAVQNGYDFAEDRWLLDSTAAWMEERLADSVNANRAHLAAGQVALPWRPLDTYDKDGAPHLGNWAFWEYLSRRYGTSIVRTMWEKSAQRGNRNTYSVQTLKELLKSRGGFASVYRSFVLANLKPQGAYPEGKHWPRADQHLDRLDRANPRVSHDVTLDHLSAYHLVARPGADLKDRRWVLRVVVDGPARETAPAVVVSVQRKKSVSRTTMPLGKSGKGSLRVPFSAGSIRKVTVTVINGSTRYRCYRASQDDNPQFSCLGKPRDDDRQFAVTLAASRPKTRR